jgi:hypothetical protein
MKRPALIFLALSAFSALSVLTAACKDDAQSKANSAPSAAPTNSAIPDDLVINSFFAQGKGVDIAVDGSAGFGEPGSDVGGAGIGEPKIKVIDPGSDPKVKLAYNFVLNKTQSIVATVGEEISGPDVPPEQGKQPTLKLTLAFTPKKKVDAGKTQIEMKVSKFEVPGMEAAKIAPVTAALAKLTGSFTVQPNGDTGDMDLDGADQLPRGSETIVNMIARVQSALYVPLPPTAVGPGAKWRTTIQQPESMLESNYTLVAKTESGWDLKLDTNTIAPPKILQDPRSGKKITVNVHGVTHYTLTSAFDGPAFKVNGDAVNDIGMSDGTQKRSNTEKMSLTVEKPAK